ncbi:MAG TPA: zf-HC2 domain-containing protein [Thermoanaerobaculia bacterium]|nr:zf-HC2 domain-containing protein [Thermoanaerobaculia bacterium]
MRDDELLRQYLLGELSGEDEALFEARLIQDDNLFESAEAMEADLLEEHAHGRLSDAQRARVRRHLASSPATRSQLAVVRGLGTVAGEEQPGRRILNGPWGRTNLSLPQVRTLAAAAMLVMGIGSVWLATRTTALPEEGEQTAEVTPAPPAPRVRPPAPPAEPPVIPDRIVQAEPTPEPVPMPTATPAPAPFLFQLALTTLRGPEDGAKELRIPAGTEQVDIHLPLSPGDESYSSFEVVLRDETGAELIRRKDLHSVRSGENADLVLPVETKLLRPGRFSVEVYGDGEDLAFPEFQVVEP